MSWLEKFKQAVNPARKNDITNKTSPAGKPVEVNKKNPAGKTGGTGKTGPAVKTGGTDTASPAGKTGGAGMANPAGKTGGTKSAPLERGGNSPQVKTDLDDSFKRQAVARLAPREREVFYRCLEGAMMKDIAAELNIKTSTVNGYCREVYKKLGVNGKVQLILLYSEYKNHVSDYFGTIHDKERHFAKNDFA